MKKHLFLAIVSTGIISIVTGCTMLGQNILPSIGEQYTPQNPSTTTPETNNIPSTTFDLTNLREQVANVEQVVNNVQRSGTYLENLNTYRTIKQQIKQVEFAVESMEKQVEASYRMGSYGVTQFWQLKNELDSMDKHLDFLEDSLEFRLGVDD